MQKQIRKIISSLEATLSGDPWYGLPVYTVLEQTDARKAHTRPGKLAHSAAELIYHMNTWTDFTLKRVLDDQEHNMAWFENLDWRTIDPGIHTWKKGVAEFKKLNRLLITALKKKNDDWLEEKVRFRKYDYLFLLEGLIQHHIYHAGQLAQLNKIQ